MMMKLHPDGIFNRKKSIKDRGRKLRAGRKSADARSAIRLFERLTKKR